MSSPRDPRVERSGRGLYLHKAPTPPREQVADADVILGNIDPDMLTACEHLQLLQLQTAGYDDYLAAGTVPAETKLSCSIGAYGRAVSEHMFAMVLSMMKRLPGYHDLQREHHQEGFGAGHLAQKRQRAGAGRGRYRRPLCHALPRHGCCVRGIKRHPLVYPIVFEDMDGMDALSERLAEATSSHPLCRAHPRPRPGERRILCRDETRCFLCQRRPRRSLWSPTTWIAALESGHLAGAAVGRHRPRAAACDKCVVGCAQHAHHAARLGLVPSGSHAQ